MLLPACQNALRFRVPAGRFCLGVQAWISTCAQAFVRLTKRRKNKGHDIAEIGEKSWSGSLSKCPTSYFDTCSNRWIAGKDPRLGEAIRAAADAPHARC